MPKVLCIKPHPIANRVLQPGRITKVTYEKGVELIRTGTHVWYDSSAPDPERLDLKRYGYFEEE